MEAILEAWISLLKQCFGSLKNGPHPNPSPMLRDGMLTFLIQEKRKLKSGSASVSITPQKPLTRVSQRVPGAHRKRSLERGWQKHFAKDW